MAKSPFKTLARLFKGEETHRDEDAARESGERRDNLPEPEPLPQRHNVPYPSMGDRFVGRVAEGWRLHDCLLSVSTDGTAGLGVITGPAGMGKTQLAAEYAHRFSRHYFGGVIWADASRGLGSTVLQLSEGAGVTIDKKLSGDRQLKALFEALDDLDSPVLVILDNFVGRPEELDSWLPPDGEIHLLVIGAGALRKFAPIRLGALSPEEGLALLNAGRRELGDEALPLIETLGGHPLALTLTERLLNDQPEVELPAVQERLEAPRDGNEGERYSQIDTLELPDGCETAIARLIEWVAETASSRAREMLKAMALLASEPIPPRLLRQMMELDDTEDAREMLRGAIDELVGQRALASCGMTEGKPFLHRVVAAQQQDKIDAGDPIYRRVITTVRGEMRKVADDKDASAYDQLREVIPHAEILQARAWVNTVEAIDLSAYLGWYFKRKGALQLGKTYRRLALQRAERAYDPGHPIIARSQSDLALILKDLGELEEARVLLEASLEAAENSEEADRSVTAMRRSNLALVLHDLGGLKDAKEQHRLALAAAKRAYEPGHPHIAKHQSNLALVLQELGELHEARGLHEKALAADEATYPEGHPIISRRRCNLALVLRDMGDLRASKVLLEAAIASDAKSPDAIPLDVAVRQCTLALVLKDLKELDQARALAERAYRAAMGTHGPEHQYTLIFKNFLDSVLK